MEELLAKRFEVEANEAKKVVVVASVAKSLSKRPRVEKRAVEVA